MEWVILAIVMLVMLPAAALPFLLSAEETMEKDVREKLTAPRPVRQLVPPTVGTAIEHRQAA